MAETFKLDRRYKLRTIDGGYEVFRGTKSLGTIMSTQEASGRPAFYLGCDNRKSPRSYRNRTLACEALEAMSKLLTMAKGKKMGLEAVILAAWDSRPTASLRS